MANRGMNAKLQRARQQIREAPQLEFTKSAYILQAPRHGLRAMAAACDVMARRISSDRPSTTPYRCVRLHHRRSRSTLHFGIAVRSAKALAAKLSPLPNSKSGGRGGFVKTCVG
jgi:hypothetical protein